MKTATTIKLKRSRRRSATAGSASPAKNVCPGCGEKGHKAKGDYWCQNPDCEIRKFYSRTKGVEPVMPND
jgi:NADH pyrophosphatase NudC (nudix superfamily)